MPVTVESNGFTGLGGRDIVCTGNKIDGGRCVVVVVNGDKTNDDVGLNTIHDSCYFISNAVEKLSYFLK